MGLFNNYSKPGPGVYENALNKKGLALFVDVFGRKFFQIMKANGIYCTASIPFFLCILFFIAPQFTEILFSNGDGTLKLTINLFVSGVIFNYYGSGPASAAYAYITRSFTRSEPVWVLSDGFDKFKENFKQSIILYILDILLLFLLVVALRFYATQASTISSILYILILSFLIVYSIAHIFMYQIMVTFECKVKDIIKNSLILTMSKLPMCLLLTTVTGITCIAIFGGLGIISIIVYATIGMSLTRFPLEFYAARILEKPIKATDK